MSTLNNARQPTWKTRKVLIICRSVLRNSLRHLEKDGITLISFVETFSAAMNILPTLRADFIISEITLSESDVWCLAEAIKTGRLCSRQPPIVALTLGQQSITLEKMAQSKGIYLYDEEIPFHGLVDYLVQVQNLRKKLIQNKTILIVEDDQNVANSIGDVLDPDFDLDFAEKGRVALSKWEKKQHNLIILDLGLPDISGLSVLKKIVTMKEQQPILILTGSPTEKNLKTCMLTGAQAFLEKPIEPSRLIHECYRALNWLDLEVIHDRESVSSTVFQIIQAANELLVTGRIMESKALLQKVKMMTPKVHANDDDYF
jgi:CheY-like chemotaxis protein